MKTFSVIFFFTAFCLSMRAQDVPVHVSDETIYTFLDELANEKIISVNSCIKPYTRDEVAMFLRQADSSSAGTMNKRQRETVRFFLQEYDPEFLTLRIENGFSLKLLVPSISYKDSTGLFVLKPVYEFSQTIHSGIPFSLSAGGAEFYGKKGRISAWAHLTDHHYKNAVLVEPQYLVNGMGGNYKYDEGGRAGADFSEMRGGVFYSWNWGRIGLIKDHVRWGDNKSGALIFSGNTPSFPMISLHATPWKWLMIDYYHGWLVSEVIDTNSTYYSMPGRLRATYRPKYIAANMISVQPWQGLFVSAGNSIVYSDKPVQAAFLIPVMFYKSIDHTLNWGLDNENSQMFMNISSRNIRHLHLYGSLFIDEFSVTRIRDKERYNFYGTKCGIEVSNPVIRNVTVYGEYTQIYPMVYKHRVPTLTYASNGYSLGYYMGANSYDGIAGIRWSVLPAVECRFEYSYAVHGEDIPYDSSALIDRHGLVEEKAWSREQCRFGVSWQVRTGLLVFASAEYSFCKGYTTTHVSSAENLAYFTPLPFEGRKNFFTVGFRLF